MKNTIKLALGRETLDPVIVDKVAGCAMIKSEQLAADDYINVSRRLNAHASYLSHVCKLFAGKDVWYRTYDVCSTRANVSVGCEQVLAEENPLMGLRGLRRSLFFEETFRKEIEMFLRVRERHTNLNLLLPVVNEVEQVKHTRRILGEYGYDGGLGIMVEIPSTALTIDEFIDAGVKYFVIGTNDLTSFTLGLSRRDETVKHLISPTHRAMALLLEHIKRFHISGVEIVVAGNLTPETIGFYRQFEFDAIAVPYQHIQSVLAAAEDPGVSLLGNIRLSAGKEIGKQTMIRQ